ncbi:oligosaccharide flippase family protein [Solirubrobacter pauli]|nr:oligosaccharide flippase family protein [Solirubrobacter pauli]
MRLRRRSSDGSASLGRQMGRAAAWSSFGSIVMRLGSFSVGIVAARLIAPDQFGVFAVALTVHAIIINVSDLGVSAYIVRHRGKLDAVGPTVTSIAMISAALLAGGMALVAPWLSRELGSVEAVDPVRVLSLTVLLAGISSVPSAVLTREFRQDKRFLADLLNFLSSTGILLALALTGGGALALAWSRVAGQAVSTVVLFAASPERFRPGFDRAVGSKVVTFGVPLIASSFLGFLIGNVDYIVVGRLLGAEPLGFYYLAYNAGSWPYIILSPIVASIAVAAFSRVRHDRAQFADRMSTSMAALLAIGIPANALIVALAHPLVGAIYGSRWAPAAAPLAWTAIYGALRLPADLLTNVTIAEGKTRGLLVLQLVYLAVLTPVTVWGVHVWGAVGAGVAHVIAIAGILLPGFLIILARTTGFGLRRLLAAAARPLAASLVAATAAHLVADRVGGVWPSLLAGGSVGVLIYLVLVASWGRRLATAARALWTSVEEPEPEPTSQELVGAHA